MSEPRPISEDDQSIETKRRIRALQEEIGVLQDSRRVGWGAFDEFECGEGGDHDFVTTVEIGGEMDERREVTVCTKCGEYQK